MKSRADIGLIVILATMTSTATANMIVTANPSTSATYPVGTSFETGEVADTTNPLGPFSDIPVQFEGFDNGGSQVTLSGSGACGFSPSYNPCLVFSYDLTFSDPTTIDSISFTGDAFNGATFELFNSSDDLVASLFESSGNVGSPVTYTMLTPGVSGTSFTLDLYDESTYWTYVKDISVNTTPEPKDLGILLPGAALLVCLILRSRKSAKA